MPIYWAILTFILLKPGSETHYDYWFVFDGIDKIVHLSIFTLLGVLVKMAFPQMSNFYFFLIGLLYGISTELAQHFMNVGRTGDVFDLLADMLGFVIAFFACRFLINKS